MVPIPLLLTVSHALFCLGIYGLLTRRHAIALLLSVELILNAAALNFVLFGRAFGQAQGQAFALFIIALAALGQQLVTTLVLPFEVISLVFVVAIVGAIALVTSDHPS